MVEGGGPATPYVHLWVRERRHACRRAGEGEADGSRSKLKPRIFLGPTDHTLSVGSQSNGQDPYLADTPFL
jgi:hypothetical protein